jgi:hypothetical protein
VALKRSESQYVRNHAGLGVNAVLDQASIVARLHSEGCLFLIMSRLGRRSRCERLRNCADRSSIAAIGPKQKFVRQATELTPALRTGGRAICRVVDATLLIASIRTRTNKFLAHRDVTQEIDRSRRCRRAWGRVFGAAPCVCFCRI